MFSTLATLRNAKEASGKILPLQSRESEVYILCYLPHDEAVPEDINPSRLRKTCDRNPRGGRDARVSRPGFMRGRVIRTEPDNTVPPPPASGRFHRHF